MEEFFGFFDGVFIGHDEEGYEKYDREYNAEDLSNVLGAFFKDGVFPKPSTGLYVQGGSDFQVKVNAGQGFVKQKFYALNSPKLLRLDDPDINFSRIDRVVLRCDVEKRIVELDVKTGIPASKPQPQQLTRTDLMWEICLAEVTIRSKANNISAGDVKDTRFNEELCGIVATAIKQLDVEDIRTEYKKSLNELVEFFDKFINSEQANILDLINQLNAILEKENAAGEIIAMVNKKQDKILKDTKNENEYVVEITDGRPFLRVVK